MRRTVFSLILLSLIAASCAQPASSEINCPQVAVGEQIIVKGAPVPTDSEWGFILDTVRWRAGVGISVSDWRLGGDLDSDSLEAVVVGEEVGVTSLDVEYAQLNREGVGAVRLVTERCDITVVEVPDFDLSGTWRVSRDFGDTECVGGPEEDVDDITITQDPSGNLTIEGLNAGYEPWSGAVDGRTVTFSGPRDESADLGGGTTQSSYALEASSRFRMQGTETWSWTDGTNSCEATTEISFRK